MSVRWLDLADLALILPCCTPLQAFYFLAHVNRKDGTSEVQTVFKAVGAAGSAHIMQLKLVGHDWPIDRFPGRRTGVPLPAETLEQLCLPRRGY